MCSPFTYREDRTNLTLVLLMLIVSTEARGVGIEEAGSGEGQSHPVEPHRNPPSSGWASCWQSDKCPYARGRGQCADARVGGPLALGEVSQGAPSPGWALR